MPDEMELDHTTHLAFERTRIAQERTLLAWVRTAMSLITFGFSIYSFFALQSGPGHPLVSDIGPRIFSLALIAVGLASLALATREHQRDQATLREIDPSLSRSSPAFTLGVIIAGLGILALALMLLRPLP